MEHAIGTRITLEDGRIAEVVEDAGEVCDNCIFNVFDSCLPQGIGGYCTEEYRTDHKNIIYKEIKEE